MKSIEYKQKRKVFLEVVEPIVQQRIKLKQIFIPTYMIKDSCITPIYPKEFYDLDNKLQKIQNNIFEGIMKA